MHSAKTSRRLCTIALVLCAHAPAFAQTSGSITGTVVDTTGGVLPGTTVTATHVPTGTKYETQSDASGAFELPNVRVGGPYSVTAQLSGFEDLTQTDIYINLGTAALVRFQLRLQAITDTVTVVAQINPIINPDRTGAS